MLILADDLGWNDITLIGGIADGTVPTPSIDSIALQGVNFTNGYAANATCAPSRAAILSGRYPTRFGFEFTPTPPGFMELTSLGNETLFPERPKAVKHVVENDLDHNFKGMPAEEVTIAESLAEQGYHSVHIGKWHVGLANGMDPLQQGFDESLLLINSLYLPEDHPDVINAKISFYRPIRGPAIDSAFHPQAAPLALPEWKATEFGGEHIGALITHNAMYGVGDRAAVQQGFSTQTVVNERGWRTDLDQGKQGDYEFGPVFHKQGDAFALLDPLCFQQMRKPVNFLV